MCVVKQFEIRLRIVLNVCGSLNSVVIFCVQLKIGIVGGKDIIAVNACVSNSF